MKKGAAIMIPKIIHYCWFGKGEMPDLAKKCMESWKQYLPDYELRRWDESSFDIRSCSYTEEAYNAKKYAFVTDYVRLYALYHYGGIYMDTDVEVIKPLDSFLSLHGFSGFEKPDEVPTGIMASEKGLPFIGELLKEYSNLHFIHADGSTDTTTNVIRITNTALKRGLVPDNTRQTIDGFTFFPMEVFCPKDPQTRQIHCTENTCTIHHFAGSWQTRERQEDRQLMEKLVNGNLHKRERIHIFWKRKYLHLKKNLKELGVCGTIRLYLKINKS